MTVNLGLLVVVGLTAAAGVYLLMERSLIRMLIGLMIVGNAVNLLIIVLAGAPGNPPVRGVESAGATGDADPLAQAMILTAIVITMGVAAFVLSLAYRLFVINRKADDDLEDDPEDLKIVTGSLRTFPDRDRTDDPETGADTAAGDFYDEHGNPVTAAEYAQLHRDVIETDLMPADVAVLAAAAALAKAAADRDQMPDSGSDEMPGTDDDEMPDSGDTDQAEAPETTTETGGEEAR